MQRYVGVDYHRKFSYLTVLDQAGKVVKEGPVENRKEVVASFLTRATCDGETAAVLEATRNWTVMYDWLEELVEEVRLAHPLKVKAAASAKIKTDKIDARVLAHLLRADLLPEAYVASPRAREVRSVLRQRMFLVRVRTMVKNRIVGLLLSRAGGGSALQRGVQSGREGVAGADRRQSHRSPDAGRGSAALSGAGPAYCAERGIGRAACSGGLAGGAVEDDPRDWEVLCGADRL